VAAAAHKLKSNAAAAASSVVGGLFNLVAKTSFADTSLGSGLLGVLQSAAESLNATAGGRSGGGAASAYAREQAGERARARRRAVGGLVLPPTAITALTFASPGESLLLLGCGDGRVVCAVDASAAAAGDADFAASLVDSLANF